MLWRWVAASRIWLCASVGSIEDCGSPIERISQSSRAEKDQFVKLHRAGSAVVNSGLCAAERRADNTARIVTDVQRPGGWQ
jgi:hypothetical protein